MELTSTGLGFVPIYRKHCCSPRQLTPFSVAHGGGEKATCVQQLQQNHPQIFSDTLLGMGGKQLPAGNKRIAQPPHWHLQSLGLILVFCL